MAKGKKEQELISWIEWQKQVYLGRARESAGVYPRISSIACPGGRRKFGVWRDCAKPLIATEIVIDCGVERRRVMYCERCKQWYCALTGKEARGNGAA